MMKRFESFRKGNDRGMKKIGFYTAAAHTQSDYVKYMEENRWRSINMMTEPERDLAEIHAFVFDYTTSQPNQSCLPAIYEQLLMVRSRSQAPMFIFIKEAKIMNRMIWYQLGANIVFDQTVKPEEFAMILSNLFSCLKKNNVEVKPRKEVLFQFYPDRLSVRLPTGKECLLTRKEYLLLEYLKKKEQAGSTHEEIYQALWRDSVEGKAYRVSNLIFNLRKKIEPNATKPRYIQTIRTIGYRLQLSEIQDFCGDVQNAAEV